MQMMPDMKHKRTQHGDLAPGERGQLIWRFTQAGTVTLPVLQSGHLEAGMRGAIAVQDSR